MEWREFAKDCPGLPYMGRYLYISDGETYKIMEYIGGMFTDWEVVKTWKYWLPVETPELPKPKFHRCEKSGICCLELELDGRKMFQLVIHNNTGFHERIYVDFCPFCGYSPKNKETT